LEREWEDCEDEGVRRGGEKRSWRRECVVYLFIYLSVSTHIWERKSDARREDWQGGRMEQQQLAVDESA